MSTQKTTADIRDHILDKALPNIIFDGWTMDVIQAAADELGYDDLILGAAFPDGVIDALDAFADKADRAMLAALTDINPDDLKVRERVQTALVTRFEQLGPHKEAVKESMKFWLNPLRKPRAAKIIWRTADVIWNWAGDTATDYNRYSKRGLLTGIIGSATLVWLNDHSDDMGKTTSFIEARIGNVMQFGKLVGSVKNTVKGKKCS